MSRKTTGDLVCVKGGVKVSHQGGVKGDHFLAQAVILGVWGAAGAEPCGARRAARLGRSGSRSSNAARFRDTPAGANRAGRLSFSGYF
jgi:hypothetical protein